MTQNHKYCRTLEVPLGQLFLQKSAGGVQILTLPKSLFWRICLGLGLLQKKPIPKRKPAKRRLRGASLRSSMMSATSREPRGDGASCVGSSSMMLLTSSVVKLVVFFWLVFLLKTTKPKKFKLFFTRETD